MSASPDTPLILDGDDAIAILQALNQLMNALPTRYVEVEGPQKVNRAWWGAQKVIEDLASRPTPPGIFGAWDPFPRSSLPSTEDILKTFLKGWEDIFYAEPGGFRSHGDANEAFEKFVEETAVIAWLERAIASAEPGDPAYQLTPGKWDELVSEAIEVAGVGNSLFEDPPWSLAEDYGFGET
jgi:hypothetical protein